MSKPGGSGPVLRKNKVKGAAQLHQVQHLYQYL